MFAPLAWLKLHYFCHAGVTEVGGFGISSAANLLYVNDFVTVAQDVTAVSVRFRDEAVADYFDRCVDAALSPPCFSRLWMHTHPGASVTPSGTDEETFARTFGACDWALMFILGRTGQTYARLAFSAGPGGQVLIPTVVDWTRWPACVEDLAVPSNTYFGQWRQEYDAHVHRQVSAVDPSPIKRCVGPVPEHGVRDGALTQAELDAELLELLEEDDFDGPYATW
jgi:hypothetical protein